MGNGRNRKTKYDRTRTAGEKKNEIKRENTRKLRGKRAMEINVEARGGDKEMQNLKAHGGDEEMQIV